MVGDERPNPGPAHRHHPNSSAAAAPSARHRSTAWVTKPPNRPLRRTFCAIVSPVVYRGGYDHRRRGRRARRGDRPQEPAGRTHRASGPRRRIRLTAVTVLTAALVVALPIGGVATAQPAADGYRYLDLPLTNRDAAEGPGGVNPVLPEDYSTIRADLEAARATGVSPRRYAALLQQYWLLDATTAAGIELSAWDPRAGAQANRDNLIHSYSYYESLQLAHRELQWAGLAGLVGADFGGGLLDLELGGDIFGLPGVADPVRAIIGTVVDTLGPDAIDRLPAGMPAVARVGTSITPQDIHQVIGMILVMQKNIFGDLMPMHQAYVTAGLPGLVEMRDAGLIGDDILAAWRDIASGDPGRIARGNTALLDREQRVVIGAQWDAVRAYRGDVGLALTYLSTVAGSPSVSGVLPPREFDPVVLTGTTPDGRAATVTVPLPNWNWSVLPERWRYIDGQVLPGYTALVDGQWPALEAQLREPYDVRIEQHRPLLSIPTILESAVRGTRVEIS